MNTERTSNIYLGQEARGALMRGVNQVADAVRVTLGAAGSNAILQSPLEPGHFITNDGVSIAHMVQLDDPVENIGANLIKEIAARADRDSGDGTTTATVLAQAILNAGMELEGNPMELKRSLDECLPIINASLDAQKKDITVDEVKQVATISGENEELGDMLQEIYQQIGKDGFVELDVSKLPTTFYEITDGIRLRNAGWLGAYSSTEPGKAVYENPFILVTTQKISTLDDIEPAMKLVSRAGKNEIVIYCDEIDMSVANELARNHLQGRFKSSVIKAPTLWKDWITEDFAEITGATVIGNATGTNLRNVRPEHFGTCAKIITTKDETRVIGVKDMTDYIGFLMQEETDEGKLRASWLQTKAAILKIGAATESEISYLRLKAEDAINATRLALQGGVVIGGGVALLEASKNLPDTIGGRILREALKAPVRQIAANAGHPERNVDCADYENGYGFDSKKVEFTNMWEAGIIDPLTVTKNSIKNAISVAGIVLTAPCVITLPKPPQHENTQQMPSM